ncbi:MAG: fibronectin type III domain-containing protein, partial [Actinobacteria bacterium]|nr:fibronectin type III domain-containing protein [Actinomycetota bacterium]
WTPPVNNGAEITGYTVTSQNGFSQQCSSTTCTLTGLTNDVEYYFTVTATNSVGTSDPSPSSGPARPDARPDQPQPPTLVFGDESLAVSWVTPPTPGSAVQSFNLEISPAPERGAASRYNVTGNALTWEGLANGTAYQVRVQAVNRAPEPSEFSAWSATEVPARAPDAPGAPTTTPATPVGNQAQISVSWGAPAANGDPISLYTLETLRGGTLVNSQQVGGTSANVAVEVNETDYSFRVSARNKAGDGAFSTESAGRRGAIPPSAPTGVSAAPTGASGTANLTFTPGATNGSRAGEVSYQYRVNQTGATGGIAPGGGQIGGLSNGTDYTFDVWAVSSVEGVQPGPSGTSNAANPYGPLGEPSVNASQNPRSVTLSWSPPPGNGRAQSFEVYVDGNLVSRDPSGSTTVGDGYNERHTIRVNVSDAAGQTSAKETSGESGNPPTPKAFISRGTPCGADDDGSSGVNNCYNLRITLEDWPGGGDVTCNWSGSSWPETLPRNSSKNTQWWSEDTPGTAYTLESQASRITCGGVQAQARR